MRTKGAKEEKIVKGVKCKHIALHFMVIATPQGCALRKIEGTCMLGTCEIQAFQQSVCKVLVLLSTILLPLNVKWL